MVVRRILVHFTPGNYSLVRGIAAPSRSAGRLDHLAIWDRPILHLESPAVGEIVLALDEDTRKTFAVSPAFPHPTPFWPGRPINPCPKPIGDIVSCIHTLIILQRGILCTI